MTQTIHIGQLDPTDAQSDGQTIMLRVGDTVRLTLEENRTTGYLWHSEPASWTAVTLRDGGFDLSPDAQIGSGGIRSFELTAIAPGQADLSFALRRPWAHEDPPLRILSVTVVVAP